MATPDVVSMPLSRWLVVLSAAGLACSSSATSSGVHPSAVESSAHASSARSAARGSPGGLPQLAGEHHPVFDLRDNRLLAHLVREGGLVVPLGHPGLAKYSTFQRPWPVWRGGHDARRGPVAVAARSETWLVVPLTAAQSRAASLVLAVASPAGQSLRVKLNGRPLSDSPLAKGWQIRSLPIPAGALRAGENRIELGWARAESFMGERRAFGAIQWIALSTSPAQALEAGATNTPASAAAAADPDLRLVRDEALWLPAAGGLAYYVFPYRESKLSVTFRGLPDLSRCTLVAELDGGAGASPRIERRTAPGGATTASTFFDLSSIAERVGRLELRAEGQGCAGLLLSEAAIVLPGPAPVVKRAERPKNVLFWLIDNARADRYRSYVPRSRVETPVIDQLAATGTLFEQPYIVGTESRVSHASIWTGLYPRQHGFIGPKARLNSSLVTLAEPIRRAGLYTAAWTANGNVSAFWGFGEGWEFFRNTLHDGGGLNAEALAGHAISFVASRGDRPFFLYIGTIDPHVSWRGRQPWLDRYFAGPYSGSFKSTVWGKDWDRLAGRPGAVSELDRRRIMAIYDSTISYNDQQLGRVLDALERKGIREQTMIVITADHGEELWEYGRIGHGGSLRETVVHVPLLIHYPPLFGRGVRVREGANAHAIFATILDALGAPIPEAVQAGSLLPLAQGQGRGYPRPSIASQYELAHVIRLERYKLWVGGKGEPKVYDLRSSQQEGRDVAASQPLVTRWLTDAMGTFLAYQDRWREPRWGVASNHSADLAADLEQRGGTSARVKP